MSNEGRASEMAATMEDEDRSDAIYEAYERVTKDIPLENAIDVTMDIVDRLQTCLDALRSDQAKAKAK